MTSIDQTISLGAAEFDPVSGALTANDGSDIALRPQSREFLRFLTRRRGEIVERGELIDFVWSGLSVTDDSLTQCIADIRKAISDTAHTIIQTIPKKGYRLVAQERDTAPEGVRARRAWPVRLIAMAASLLLVAALGTWAVANGVLGSAAQPTIAVLPFDDQTGDPRWQRLGRGLAIGISNELARGKDFGVIGSETTFDAASLGLAEAGRALNATYVIGGSIRAQETILHVSARLLSVDDGFVLWSEEWQGSTDDYLTIQDDIVARANASLVAYFWFGALNRAVAERAKDKPQPALSAFEEYLLGIENILWKKADYGKALRHFERAVEIEPNYARAWAMIGVMKLWIADVSDDPVREVLAQ